MILKKNNQKWVINRTCKGKVSIARNYILQVCTVTMKKFPDLKADKWDIDFVDEECKISALISFRRHQKDEALRMEALRNSLLSAFSKDIDTASIQVLLRNKKK